MSVGPTNETCAVAGTGVEERKTTAAIAARPPASKAGCRGMPLIIPDRRSFRMEKKLLATVEDSPAILTIFKSSGWPGSSPSGRGRKAHATSATDAPLHRHDDPNVPPAHSFVGL